jgi:hypothetical protein
MGKRAADDRADRQSLDRAADLEEVYQEMSWVEEMPEPKRRRGRRPKRDSREQFAKWVKHTYGWGSQDRLSQLHIAYELVPILTTHVVGIRPAGEGTLRPLAKVRAQGYADHQAEVWAEAVKIAEGEPPTPAQVRKAVTEFLDRHQPPIKNLAADPRTPAEKRADRLARMVAEFDALADDEMKTAYEFVTTVTQHYNARRVAVREARSA